MFIKPNYSKTNNLISYRLICSGADPLTGDHKNYTKTWKVPNGLTNKEIKHQLKIVEIDFEKEVEKISLGLAIEECNIKFVDFANQFLDEILIRNSESYTYYNKVKENLKVINPFFDKYLLRNITPSVVQSFYNYICTRTYKKQIIVVKKSINDLINELKISKCKLADEIGINRLTLRLAGKIGQQINMSTVKAISKFFNIDKSKYFDITTQDCKYSRATNSSIRTTLVMILGEAKRRRLIEHNFATKEFTKPITGTTKEKDVYNETEAREFIKCIFNEKDIRKKSILSLLILLAFRRSEIAGLCWSDINFEDSTISVNRNSIYTSSFGIKTKCPKTKSSKRTISMPETLVQILKEYKAWWKEQQRINGDYGDWSKTDRLFVQTNGLPMNPCTVGQWVRNFEISNGFKHIPPHSLRHTAITLQIIANIPLKVVSERAGHANEKITLGIYTHSLKHQDKQASEIYNNFLCKNLNKNLGENIYEI